MWSRSGARKGECLNSASRRSSAAFPSASSGQRTGARPRPGMTGGTTPAPAPGVPIPPLVNGVRASERDRAHRAVQSSRPSPDPRCHSRGSVCRASPPSRTKGFLDKGQWRREFSLTFRFFYAIMDTGTVRCFVAPTAAESSIHDHAPPGITLPAQRFHAAVNGVCPATIPVAPTDLLRRRIPADHGIPPNGP